MANGRKGPDVNLFREPPGRSFIPTYIHPSHSEGLGSHQRLSEGLSQLQVLEAFEWFI